VLMNFVVMALMARVSVLQRGVGERS
jgi:hypothetical protein